MIYLIDFQINFTKEIVAIYYVWFLWIRCGDAFSFFHLQKNNPFCVLRTGKRKFCVGKRSSAQKSPEGRDTRPKKGLRKKEALDRLVIGLATRFVEREEERRRRLPGCFFCPFLLCWGSSLKDKDHLVLFLPTRLSSSFIENILGH